jgi:conjugative transfer signal peptidase TraF
MRTWSSGNRPARTERLLRFGAVTMAAAVVVAASCVLVRRAGLAWNRTPSLPIGIYSSGIVNGSPRRGQIVAIHAPESVRDLVVARGYLKPGEQLFKRIVGAPGDRVCLSGSRYEVNGNVIGPIFAADREGLPLPSFAFCGTVPADTYWLGTPSPRSFDSRYFGPVPGAAVLSVLEPRWTF